jgi:hypothetical protein
LLSAISLSAHADVGFIALAVSIKDYAHAFGMFMITEADADAIRAVFNQEGELSAAIELAEDQTNDGAGRINGFVVPESCPKIPAADLRLCPTEVAGRAEARHLGAAPDVITC